MTTSVVAQEKEKQHAAAQKARRTHKGVSVAVLGHCGSCWDTFSRQAIVFAGSNSASRTNPFDVHSRHTSWHVYWVSARCCCQSCALTLHWRLCSKSTKKRQPLR